MIWLLKLKAMFTRKCVVALRDIDGEVTYRVASKNPFGYLMCNRYFQCMAVLEEDGTVSSPRYVKNWKLISDYRKG